jgi:hypothetical protein
MTDQSTTPRLTYSSLPREIKHIANESLGVGVLRSLFSYAKTYHLIIKISDGVFVGFALYHYHHQKMKDGSDYITGVIDCVCVSTAYRKEGFGTLLTFGVLRKMSAYGTDRIEIMLKTPGTPNRDTEPGVPLIGNEDLLLALGFRKVKTFKDNYLKISKRYGYDCLICGSRPDTCKAVLYAIDSD